MSVSGIEGEFQGGVLPECTPMATCYDNLTINKVKKVIDRLNGLREDEFLRKLKRIGEICVRNTKDEI
jgi:hypothetical protein